MVKVFKLVKWIFILLLLLLATVLGLRAWDAWRAEPLKLWHTHVPDDVRAKAIDQLDWAGYLALEKKLFDDVRREVTDQLPEEDRVLSNRYFSGSPLYPGGFKNDWNRSYILLPAGKPVGTVVLLHGLTDSPYSLRHVARRYRDLGWVAVAPRLPGHGTVPSGLSEVEWEDWTAATRLAVREAQRLAPGAPLHVVGFSNGGALAMKYALDALDDVQLARPTRIVLISPMIGITELARLAGIFGWPAVFPAFAPAAWLGIVPEFNPFKYNSFPVNGGRQSSLVARTLQAQIVAASDSGKIAQLPPILTFQSVVDFTVSTRAIIDALYSRLPANGSELVLFDLNRNAKFGPLLSPNPELRLERMLPAPPRRYSTVVITNASANSADMIARVVPAGASEEQVQPLALTYPFEVFSLSHVALPFPVEDPLYGMKPDLSEDYGANLGTLAVRGERGALVVSLDSLIRMSSNPFYPYMIEKIEHGITAGK
ncbi:MAG: alpha/beta hydrolase [Burkholderiales bacterium]|jgi:alpha-beta hydrolase superfamily lysophospholipase|nr:alpha/beta hydrolase [Burkholderiales bacterium]